MHFCFSVTHPAHFTEHRIMNTFSACKICIHIFSPILHCNMREVHSYVMEQNIRLHNVNIVSPSSPTLSSIILSQFCVEFQPCTGAFLLILFRPCVRFPSLCVWFWELLFWLENSFPDPSHDTRIKHLIYNTGETADDLIHRWIFQLFRYLYFKKSTSGPETEC